MKAAGFKKKAFFFEKKNQKTFEHWAEMLTQSRANMQKFFAFFSKKKCLPFFQVGRHRA